MCLWNRLFGNTVTPSESQLKRGYPPMPKPIPPPPPRPETDEERLARQEREQVEEDARDKLLRRNALQQRFRRLLEKIDYSVYDEPYDQLGFGEADQQAGDIVEAVNNIVDLGVRLGVWDQGMRVGKAFADSARKEIAALLYAGLRQEITRFLCKRIMLAGVDAVFVNEAYDRYDRYHGDDTAYDEYDSPAEDDE